jgi:RHS repeat-associated protein
LLLEIPADERLITLEDAAELRLDGHPNAVRLFYSKDDQGLARITPKRLLYYYRARNYSPKLGRFLQTDPAGFEDELNLYAYARNEPLMFIDHGGQRVVLAAGTTKVQRTAYWKTVAYMSQSATFKEQFAMVASSPITVTVVFTDTGSVFNGENNELSYDPSEGLQLDNGSIQSPGLGFGHEIAHAARALSDPEGYAAENMPSETSIEFEPQEGSLPEVTVKWGTTAEDARVMKIESSMASELDEPQRNSHDEGVYVPVPSVTYSCVAGASKPCK